MFKKLWYEFLFWLTGTAPYHFFMKYVGPKLRGTTDYPRPDNEKYEQWGALERKGYEKLSKGDIILTIDSKKFVAKVIGNATKNIDGAEVPFVPSHAAICVEKNRSSDFEIAEMTMRNFTESTWEDVVRESTRVVIGYCPDWDQPYINDKVIPKVLTFTNKKYDERFQMGEDTLACSELVYFGDEEHRLKADIRPLIGDKPYITPVGLMLSPNFRIKWDSNWEQ